MPQTITCINLYQDIGNGKVVIYIPIIGGGVKAEVLNKEDVPKNYSEGSNPLSPQKKEENV